MEGKSLTWSPNRAKFSSPSSSRDYGLCRLSPRDPSLTRLINRSIPFEIRFSIEIRRKEERNEFSSFFFPSGKMFSLFASISYRESSVEIRMEETRTN